MEVGGKRLHDMGPKTVSEQIKSLHKTEGKPAHVVMI